MKLILIITGIAAVALFGLIIYSYYKGKNAPEIKTSKQIRQITNKNIKQQIRKGIVLLDFWASWCAPCKMMLPILNEIAEDEGRNVSVGKVNVDQQRVLAKKYKIRSIPTLIILKNGFEVGRIVGVKSKKVVLKEIENATLRDN